MCTRRNSHSVVAGLVTVLALSLVARDAHSDMGSILVERIRSNSVVLSWADPGSGHELATDPGTYRVWWKSVNSPYSLYDNEFFATGNPGTVHLRGGQRVSCCVGHQERE